jgi:hypothetical protein
VNTVLLWECPECKRCPGVEEVPLGEGERTHLCRLEAVVEYGHGRGGEDTPV